jgi:hypothetical protein
MQPASLSDSLQPDLTICEPDSQSACHMASLKAPSYITTFLAVPLCLACPVSTSLGKPLYFFMSQTVISSIVSNVTMSSLFSFHSFSSKTTFGALFLFSHL